MLRSDWLIWEDGDSDVDVDDVQIGSARRAGQKHVLGDVVRFSHVPYFLFALVSSVAKPGRQDHDSNLYGDLLEASGRLAKVACLCHPQKIMVYKCLLFYYLC